MAGDDGTASHTWPRPFTSFPIPSLSNAQIRYTTELREVWASGKCPSKQEGLACVAALVPLLTAQDEPVRQTSTAALYCLLEGHKAIL